MNIQQVEEWWGSIEIVSQNGGGRQLNHITEVHTFVRQFKVFVHYKNSTTKPIDKSYHLTKNTFRGANAHVCIIWSMKCEISWMLPVQYYCYINSVSLQNNQCYTTHMMHKNMSTNHYFYDFRLCLLWDNILLVSLWKHSTWLSSTVNPERMNTLPLLTAGNRG